MKDIQGRTAFITGGANGIGLGIARALARAGAKLALVDLDDGALERAKAELEGVTQVETYKLDVRDRDAYAATAQAVEQALGPVTILVNNAGVAAGAPIAKMTYELWDFGIGINLGGVINGIQTFVPGMITRGQGGYVVNTASGAGLVGVTTPLYCSAKFGVVGLSESMVPELAAAGIGVSVLCPGPVATDIVNRSAAFSPDLDEPLTEEQQQQAAAGRAQSTAFLAQGTSIDTVGQMVLDAMTENRLFIHTDRMLEEPIKARTQALLEAMPD